LPFLLSFITLFAAAQVRHVVLVSIDGLRPEMYLDSSWPAPNLRHLMRLGVYADHMRSVFPSLTYPSHTAMLTGALPARSGIYFNQPKTGEWDWFASPIRVPTFSAVKPELFYPVHGGHHGYDSNFPSMYTGFIAAWPGIRTGTRIDDLCVTDIAPLVGALLGIRFKTPDGKLVPGILR
jgi:arylsulfatase A-like enzyme